MGSVSSDSTQAYQGPMDLQLVVIRTWRPRLARRSLPRGLVMTSHPADDVISGCGRHFVLSEPACHLLPSCRRAPGIQPSSAVKKTTKPQILFARAPVIDEITYKASESTLQIDDNGKCILLTRDVVASLVIFTSGCYFPRELHEFWTISRESEKLSRAVTAPIFLTRVRFPKS